MKFPLNIVIHPAVWTVIVLGTVCMTLAAEESLRLQQMRQLVDDFTYVMHLETDRDLYNRIRSSFSSELKDYLDSDRAADTNIRSLVQQILMGAFKLRAYATKDSLASGRAVTVSRRDFTSVANWSLDLLREVIQSTHLDLRKETVGVDLNPLELAVKLQMTGAVSLLLENGAVVCTSLFPLKCSDALHHAVINEDQLTVSLIMDTLRKEVRSMGCKSKQVLCSIVSEKGQNVAFSPLQIAHLHCLSGLSCVAYETILTDVNMDCVLNATLDTRNLFTAVIAAKAKGLYCPTQTIGTNFKFGSSANSSLTGPSNWLPWALLGYQGRRSGWGVYYHFHVGQEGCDLPRVSLSQLSPHQLEEFFGKLSIPVVLEDVTKEWRLFDTWRRATLLKKWRHLDVLVGPIPYGEVFGEKHGYTTIEQFLSYMDKYAVVGTFDDSLGSQTQEFRAPLYVFDNGVLEKHFQKDYSLPEVFSISNPIRQFILGPAGSGAPVHFHCHALNTLIYGRKKWFLFPPGSAMYSKQHPLPWFQKNYNSLAVKPIECLQKSGETLYVPSGWAHATVNLDESIGLAAEFDTEDC